MSERARILVIDDEEGWLETTKGILEPTYDLTTLTDPALAVAELKKASYALVILDMNLPGISGVELLKKLRLEYPELRAIILTGYADVDSAVESMKIGALDYISKGTAQLADVLRGRVAEALTQDSTSTRDINSLIARGEGAELEFKATVRWDVRNQRLNKDLEKVVVKTVAAFFNSEHGGNLLLGVDDNGVVVGLKSDYCTLKKQNRDGFENLIMTLLIDAFGTDCTSFVEVLFHQVGGEDVCQIIVKPSPTPRFVPDDKAEHLFVRAGNSTRLLSTREAIEYCNVRWPRLSH